MTKNATRILSVTFCVVFVAAQLYEGDVCKTVRGVKWTCKKVKQCQKVIQLLQSGGWPQMCGFYQNEPIVCCEPSSDDTSTTTTTTTTTRKPKPKPKPTTPQPSVSGKKASEMCEKYAGSVFISIGGWDEGSEDKLDTCEKVEALITNGQKANPREFPHMAQIGYGNRNNIKWRCGGSLISENFVLSAAHCTEIYGVKAGWVRLGAYFSKSQNESTSIEQPAIYKISARYDHPQYKEPSSENDIALYRLETSVTFDLFVRPTCLQTETVLSTSSAIACGWGNTQFGGKSSDELQKVNLTVISNKECKRMYKANDNNLPQGLVDSMLCAEDLKREKDKGDTCQGDSGGPLQIKHPRQYCMYSLIGVTSFGEGCAIKAGVYTRVSHFVPWIESIVWK